MSAPFFSIIMNVYNGAQHLEQTLRCALTQTFTDWELVFWDDCSTDGSASILDRFDDRRIRYFRSETQLPLSAAREKAVHEARGSWIAFLDQDDLWSSDKLEIQHELARDGDERLGIIYTGCVDFDCEGNRRIHDHWHDKAAPPKGQIFQELFRYGNFIAMSSTALRRDLVNAALPFPSQFSFLTDYHLNVHVSANHLAAVSPRICCWYRHHPNSATSRNAVEMFRQTLAFVKQWEGALPPKIYRKRIRIQSTLLGFALLCQRSRLLEALHYIIVKGSLPYLLTRPLARMRRKRHDHCLPAPPESGLP